MRRFLLSVLTLLLVSCIGHTAEAQSRSMPAQYRQAAQRMYLKRLQTRLKVIRPRAQTALQQPSPRGGSGFKARGTNSARLHRQHQQRRMRSAGRNIQPRMLRSSASRTSDYKRTAYSRNIRLRSRTVGVRPPKRMPSTYNRPNRSLSAWPR